MELSRVPLARVCRKGRLPKLVGLQSSDSSRGNRCSLALGIGGKDFNGEIKGGGSNRGRSEFFTRVHAGSYLLGDSSGSLVGDKLLPLPQPPVRARTDARTNPSAQRATQLRHVLARVYAVSMQNQITTTVP
jgi:hypothetical protein